MDLDFPRDFVAVGSDDLAGASKRWIRPRVPASRSRSISRSWRAWRLSQNWSEVPKNLASRRDVSAVMDRFPWTISLIRRGGTSVSLARVLTDPQGNQVLLQQDLAGMDRGDRVGHGVCSVVVLCPGTRFNAPQLCGRMSSWRTPPSWPLCGWSARRLRRPKLIEKVRPCELLPLGVVSASTGPRQRQPAAR